MVIGAFLAAALLGCLPAGTGSEVPSVGQTLPSADARFGMLLDEALGRFGEPTTDESRATAREVLSAALAEARESGGCESCTELTIVEQMLELPAPSDASFEEAARFAVAAILSEELYEERS
jgi:hypothetical protein